VNSNNIRIQHPNGPPSCSRNGMSKLLEWRTGKFAQLWEPLYILTNLCIFSFFIFQKNNCSFPITISRNSIAIKQKNSYFIWIVIPFQWSIPRNKQAYMSPGYKRAYMSPGYKRQHSVFSLSLFEKTSPIVTSWSPFFTIFILV